MERFRGFGLKHEKGLKGEEADYDNEHEQGHGV